jgi:hypothetical protein
MQLLQLLLLLLARKTLPTLMVQRRLLQRRPPRAQQRQLLVAQCAVHLPLKEPMRQSSLRYVLLAVAETRNVFLVLRRQV